MDVEKVTICCLQGVGDQHKDTKIIPLNKEQEVVIGRSLDATVSIQSDMISRKHAILQKHDDQWSIRDNMSLNGIFINGNRLEKRSVHVLKNNDNVQLGTSLSKGSKPPFVWIYKDNLRVKKLKKTTEPSEKDDQYHISSQTSACGEGTKSATRSENSKEKTIRKRSHSPEPCEPSTSDCDVAKKRKIINSPIKAERLKREHEFQRLQKEQEEKLRLMQEQQAKVEAELKCMQEERDQMKQELQHKEEEMKRELERKQEELQKQKEEAQELLKSNYQKELKEREKELLDRLSGERKRLIEEKSNVERSLQNELERKLEEKDKDLEDRLQKQKESLEKIIDQKETEQRFLISELDDFKEENEKQKETVFQNKEAILSEFSDLMETELQCSICGELFIKATSLNCSHSFCELCIQQWMDVKKQCPVCREPITSHLNSRVLDSYIDRMVEHLNEDMKARRATMIQERKDELEKREQDKRDKLAAALTAVANRGRNTRGGRGRGGRRGAGRRGATGGRRSARPNATLVQSRALVISSSSDTDSDPDFRHRHDNSNNNNESHSDSNLEVAYEVEVATTGEVPAYEVEIATTAEDSHMTVNSSPSGDEYDSNESMEGASGWGYYGGYGRCYSCGRRGHWANDCPFD